MTTIAIPEGSLFGLDNLPYGIFSTADSEPRVGVRVGDSVLDLSRVFEDDIVFAEPSLNAFMARGRARWDEVRAAIKELVAGDVADEAVFAVTDVTMHLPIEVADYVDFYASENHASNLGRLFRPQNPDPLMPNWKHLPVGYHGRSSTVVTSGVDIVRPCGQRKGPNDPGPVFGPSIRLDIEAEMGFIVGVGSPMVRGSPPTSSPTTASARSSSTTGRPATSRRGSTCRWARTSASPSRRRSRRGSFRSPRSRRPASTPRCRTRNRCRT